jgi:myosin-5
MSQNSQALPSFQSIQSLPGDFRFTGSPASDCLEKSDDRSLGNTYLISSSIPENGDSRDGVFEGVEGYRGQVIEDSPYSGNAISVEDRPLIVDEELDSVVSHLSSISASRNEYRWDDTTSYTAKKVFCGFWLKFSFPAKL